HTDLVPVLHVLANAGKVHDGFDAELLQFIARPDSREFQELRAIERAAGNNNLAVAAQLPLLRIRSALREWRSAIEEAPRHIFDTDRLPAFKQHPAYQRIRLDDQVVGELGGGRQDALPQARTEAAHA